MNHEFVKLQGGFDSKILFLLGFFAKYHDVDFTYNFILPPLSQSQCVREQNAAIQVCNVLPTSGFFQFQGYQSVTTMNITYRQCSFTTVKISGVLDNYITASLRYFGSNITVNGKLYKESQSHSNSMNLSRSFKHFQHICTLW